MLCVKFTVSHFLILEGCLHIFNHCSMDLYSPMDRTGASKSSSRVRTNTTKKRFMKKAGFASSHSRRMMSVEGR